jgi:hypothetical protein
MVSKSYAENVQALLEDVRALPPREWPTATETAARWRDLCMKLADRVQELEKDIEALKQGTPQKG